MKIYQIIDNDVYPHAELPTDFDLQRPDLWIVMVEWEGDE